MALEWHPDKNREDTRLMEKAEEKFKEIKAAYEFLVELEEMTINLDL